MRHRSYKTTKILKILYFNRNKIIPCTPRIRGAVGGALACAGKRSRRRWNSTTTPLSTAELGDERSEPKIIHGT